MAPDLRPIIFLDIDGVLNCQTFYESRKPTDDRADRMQHYANQLCSMRIGWLNELCASLNAVVVITSVWRLGRTVDELRLILRHCGATFEVIDKTGHTGYERGTEISQWLKRHIMPEVHGCHYFDFDRYVIIDDDSDMLLTQQAHFFKTDPYSGLTPNTCYKIKRFLTGNTFDETDAKL